MGSLQSIPFAPNYIYCMSQNQPPQLLRLLQPVSMTPGTVPQLPTLPIAKRYLYLDLQPDAPFVQLLELVDSSDCDSEESVEQLGGLLISNLKNLSQGGRQMHRYLAGLDREKGRAILTQRANRNQLHEQPQPQPKSEQEISDFIDKQQSKLLHKRLSYGERQLAKKITVLGEARHKNGSHFLTDNSIFKDALKDARKETQQIREPKEPYYETKRILAQMRQMTQKKKRLPPLTSRSVQNRNIIRGRSQIRDNTSYFMNT